MKKYVCNINNLDCPNCARKLEEKLNNRDDLNEVIVNFNTKKLIYKSDKDYSISEINNIVKSYEPNAKITKDIEQAKEFHLSFLLIGVTLGLMAYFINFPSYIKTILFIIAYILLLHRVFIKAIKLLINSHTLDENILITISCVGAYLLGEPLEGMMVIGLYTIGKILEEKALNKSRKEIENLVTLKIPYANLKKNNEVIKVNVEDIKVGDLLIIKKGEKVPVDGIVVEGNSSIDTSMLTGESEEVLVNKSSEVLSGSINKGNVITMKATKIYSESVVSKILDLLENATNSKAKTETIVSRISKFYTPIVIVLAILVIVLLPLLFNMSYNDSIYRGLTFLVIACPCAIAISVPLSYFIGIGVSGRNGILVKGSNYLDNLSLVKKIVFDKTGTITSGEFKVEDIIVTDKKYTKQEVIDILCKGESLSNHPIARSIMKLSKNKVNNKDVTNFKEIDGGISYNIKNDKIKIGSKKICNCDIETTLHLNINGKHVASIIINDGIKDNVNETIDYFKNNNIKTYMFTGDKKDIANEIGNKLGIDEIKAEMLPTDKYSCYEEIRNDDITIFVGDGINDAPVLKRADIGISMGNLGSDIAIDASDIVIMNDELNKIPRAINISKYVRKIIKQNLIFAISVKIIVLILSTLGLVNMWLAVFADTGLTLLTILNSLRILKKFR
jgi:Cd2+/Zn2+-exporting ATPase